MKQHPPCICFCVVVCAWGDLLRHRWRKMVWPASEWSECLEETLRGGGVLPWMDQQGHQSHLPCSDAFAPQVKGLTSTLSNQILWNGKLESRMKNHSSESPYFNLWKDGRCSAVWFDWAPDLLSVFHRKAKVKSVDPSQWEHTTAINLDKNYNLKSHEQNLEHNIKTVMHCVLLNPTQNEPEKQPKTDLVLWSACYTAK